MDCVTLRKKQVTEYNRRMERWKQRGKTEVTEAVCTRGLNRQLKGKESEIKIKRCMEGDREEEGERAEGELS